MNENDLDLDFDFDFEDEEEDVYDEEDEFWTRVDIEYDRYMAERGIR